jgi:hypothetical protein
MDLDPGLKTAPQKPWERDREGFTDALVKVCERSDLPNNPIQALWGEIFPLWRACHARLDQEYKRPGPRRYEPDGLRREAVRNILREWARRYGLIFPISDDSSPDAGGVAAEWLVDWADDWLTSVQQRNVVVVRPQDMAGQPGTKTLIRIGPAGSLPSSMLSRRFIIPMDKPDRQPGESWKKFRARVSQAAREQVDQLKRESKLRTPKPPQRRKAGTYQSNHYEFLALRICGLKWTEIRAHYREYKSDSSIIKGAQKIAGVVGLHCPTKSQ